MWVGLLLRTLRGLHDYVDGKLIEIKLNFTIFFVSWYELAKNHRAPERFFWDLERKIDMAQDLSKFYLIVEKILNQVIDKLNLPLKFEIDNKFQISRGD